MEIGSEEGFWCINIGLFSALLPINPIDSGEEKPNSCSAVKTRLVVRVGLG